MLGRYRINHANSVFPGKPGVVFQSTEGPLLTAAVLSGAVSRVDPPSREDNRPSPGPLIGDPVDPDQDNPDLHPGKPEDEPTVGGSDLHEHSQIAAAAIEEGSEGVDDQTQEGAKPQTKNKRTK
jgi:hypothetical protein